ncbi:hypothetical protein LOD99_12320 [Oopsacas minuta]|uniref:Uncharacterized protein n=1 Tax=Oopsacas minuta TaxID=111878 RepID=A0AAV7JER4_9METZ|nr:hypothetical protein LOD99_12320 [Oopsacas minuta]
MNYNRQLKEADRMLQEVTSTHHNILSIGGDLFSRYEKLCEDKLRQAVEENEEKLLRHHTELTQQAVAEAVELGRRGMETALIEARVERDNAIIEKEREVREDMNEIADALVRQEYERGKLRKQEAVDEAKEISRIELISRIEDVRLEEKELSGQKLNELSEQDNIYLEKVRENDRTQAELNIQKIESEFNSKLSLKQNEIEVLLANIHKLEENLNSKDEQINKLEIQYENSRIEFSHFVDTMSEIGGGYTVRKDPS